MKVKRVLTRKSKIGFGKYKKLTIQRILELRKPIVIISCYFKLSTIDFTEDILNELEICDRYRIIKPGKSLEKYYQFLEDKGFSKKKHHLDRNNVLKRSYRMISKGRLQRFNQGKN